MKSIVKYIAILLLMSPGLLAQVQFEARASKQTLAMNERLRVDFTMNGDGDNFVPPSFEGFRVVAGPSQQVSQSWVNGKTAFSKTYSYFLLPTQRGQLTIKQAAVEINGQIYKTSPIKITVTAAVEQPRDPNEISVSADDALHLVADVSKTDPYLNEPITVVYKLYFNYNIGITNFRELDKPKYNDFWSQNIEIKQLQVEEGRYNGEKYRYIVLKKTVLYPQKSGKLEIEPLSLDIDVELPSNRRTIFGQMIPIQDNKRVSAGARTINVKPLPEAGKPADFSGAVGKFDFKVTPSRTVLKNGESLDLVVSVNGSGNLKLFSLPKPVVPAALEMYDPVHKENVSTTLSGMSGRVSDSYAIIPQFRGKYPIKPISFTYFDPSARKYKTITSPEIMINVMDGPEVSGVGPAQANATPAEAAKNPVASQAQFKFIKLKTSLGPMKESAFLGSGLFYALVSLPLLCIPLLMLARRKQLANDADVAGNKARHSQRLVRKYLSEAGKNMGDKESFYNALERALHNFLRAKLGIETSEMRKENIREILIDRGAQAESAGQFISLVESCELARYAPASSGSIKQDYDRAAQVMQELEKQLK